MTKVRIKYRILANFYYFFKIPKTEIIIYEFETGKIHKFVSFSNE